MRTAPISTLGAVPQSIRRQGDQELLVDRLEEQEVEVAGAHQLGELVAVFQEQRLDQAVEGEEAAHEEEVVGLGPVGDVAGPGEDRPVEGDAGSPARGPRPRP